ncbi:hypothetical protein QAD02_009204 [Eretmocerus hayati]|uniref:Uncharacterized protein n=2 Tax=Eretmocerus hayati TaxID=131215 RepID=A0ACC2N8L1_9HYME|nr:hypothetical protein QAD02_009203 [Eretmocerus hayati]KAJ8667541.1 hypothetical protein QAD02_009204 [Eretmocerus hayati]
MEQESTEIGAQKSKKLMRPRNLGAHWEGFTPVRKNSSSISIQGIPDAGEENVDISIQGAKCHNCRTFFSKHCRAFLLAHREQCLKNQSSATSTDVSTVTSSTSGITSIDQSIVTNGNASGRSSTTPSVLNDPSIRQQQQTSAAVVCSSKKRKSDEPAIAADAPLHVAKTLPTSQKVDEQENIGSSQSTYFQKINGLVAKMFLRLGVSFEETKSVHVQNLLAEIHENYEVPPVSEFEGQIVSNALQHTTDIYSSKQLTGVMYVQVDTEAGHTYLLSAAITDDGQYIAVDWCQSKEHTIESFGNFCKKCIDTVKESYNVYLSFIVTNSLLIPEPIHYPKDRKFVFYLNTFSELISQLKRVVFVVTTEKVNEAHNFNKVLDYLDINLASMSMSKAVSLIMDMKDIDGCIDGKYTIQEVISFHLEPTHFLCMYLNPLYHAYKMSDVESEDIFNYLALLMKDKTTMACLGDYHHKSKLFGRLFNSTPIDPNIFWLRAIVVHENLSDEDCYKCCENLKNNHKL